MRQATSRANLSLQLFSEATRSIVELAGGNSKNAGSRQLWRMAEVLVETSLRLHQPQSPPKLRSENGNAFRP